MRNRFGLLLVAAWVSLFYMLLPVPIDIRDAIEKNLTDASTAFEESASMNSVSEPAHAVERAAVLSQAVNREVIYTYLSWAAWSCLIACGASGGLALHRKAGGRSRSLIGASIYLLYWAASLVHLQQSEHNNLFETLGRSIADVALGGSTLALVGYVHQFVVLPAVFIYALCRLTLRTSDQLAAMGSPEA